MASNDLADWRNLKLYAATFSLGVFLTACGGGGSDSTGAAAKNATPCSNGTALANCPDPTSGGDQPVDLGAEKGGDAKGGDPSVPRPDKAGDSPSTDGTPPPLPPPASGPVAEKPPASSPFAADVTIAPEAGASIAGSVLLEVRGSGMRNAELLPASGYVPRLTSLEVSADGTRASTDFDTLKLPNGNLIARIAAFNVPAGQSGAESTAMPAREWLIRNDPAPFEVAIPPPSVMPQALVPLYNLPYVDPQPLQVMQDQSDAEFEAMLRDDWPRVRGVMRQYVPENVVLVPPTPLGFAGPWGSCVDTPTMLACREAMRYMANVMKGKAQ